MNEEDLLEIAESVGADADGDIIYVSDTTNGNNGKVKFYINLESHELYRIE